MPKIELNVYFEPSKAEIFVNFKETSGEFKLRTALVDTGAEQSLFPLEFLDLYEHTIVNQQIEIDQAGIAKQAFKAIEAIVTVYFEDRNGNETEPMQVRAWFAETEEVIIGFQDILDRATLHVDYRQGRSGWIEF